MSNAPDFADMSRETSFEISGRSRWFAGLMVSASTLFGLGLIFGLVYTFVLIGRIEIWPLPWSFAFDGQADSSAWRRAHVGTLINSLMIFVFALAADKLRMPRRTRTVYSACVQSTAWLNSLAFALAAFVGARGLSGGAGLGNTLIYILFLIAVVTAFFQVYLLARQAVRVQQY